ncbi:hypothetical protein F6W96_14030 [Nocardia terpenica]|uniref:Uncharacterized protein n=1 Tax=Nocardia terpenica TaxID=455432 RepID=A0A6G9Z0V0_9NOCA|nr:hypothetical protein [Nocardia terpenica]QIS19239.1 hypothetical protein F6W96_14030 [Nocardia terpenica]
MGTRNIQTGRHRLGTAGTVHCLHIPAVAAALAEYRRPWLTTLLSPARHSFAAIRKRTAVATPYWVPAPAS